MHVRLVVHGRSRLIQQDDLGAAADRARDTEDLSLALAEVFAVGGDGGVEGEGAGCWFVGARFSGGAAVHLDRGAGG